MNVLLQRTEDVEKHVWASSHFCFALFWFFFFRIVINFNKRFQKMELIRMNQVLWSLTCTTVPYATHSDIYVIYVQQKNSAEANKFVPTINSALIIQICIMQSEKHIHWKVLIFWSVHSIYIYIWKIKSVLSNAGNIIKTAHLYRL